LHKRWLDPVLVDVPDELHQAVGGHPLVAETLTRRGTRSREAAQGFLDPVRYAPASPSALPDMESAVARVRSAIRQREPICVWGDFDVDGQTSTALLVSALRDLGANVGYHIPNRQSEGHGIDLAALARVIDAGAKLIVTCDTGISAHEAVDYANLRGVDVVITDHHNLPPTLPNAYAVVNPKRLPDDHPLRELPGVGVAYKLIEALNGDTQLVAMPDLLDLVALGIVADVAQQVGDTRYLLQRGLERLRKTERLGLRAMIELAEIDPARITEEHIGFSLAPRLNALGRLEGRQPCRRTADDARPRTGTHSGAAARRAERSAKTAGRAGLRSSPGANQTGFGAAGLERAGAGASTVARRRGWDCRDAAG